MINHFAVQGRFIRDPELSVTAGGVNLCSFRIAWSGKAGQTERKLFLNCVAWRSLGEFIYRYFRKGQEIVLEGDLVTREWQDKNGQTRSSIEMTVFRAHFCGEKKKDGAEPEKGQEGWTSFEGGTTPFDEDDLPY